MPELPEVQVVINYLNKHIINKTVINIKVLLPKLLKNIKEKDFCKTLINHQFKEIIRRGKYLIFILDNNKVMVSHLRMEGKYNFDTNINFKKHDHIIFEFKDHTYLKYNDSRQFGTINIYNDINEALSSKELEKLGIEPLSDYFNIENVYPLFKKSNNKLKTFLLDQSNITGIGNIYANEICFATKIHPISITNHLTKNDVQKIIDATKNILSDSIKHNGTTIHTFSFSQWDIGNYQDKLLVHGKKICSYCNNNIKKSKINGRGTYTCEKCQKIK